MSSLKPAIAGEGLFGCSGVVEIALEDDRAADLEIADDASGDCIIVGPFGNSHLDTGHASTNGRELQRALLVIYWALRMEDGTSTSLSHTETRNNDVHRSTILGQYSRQLRSQLRGCSASPDFEGQYGPW